jgi:hypothetical protein
MYIQWSRNKEGMCISENQHSHTVPATKLIVDGDYAAPYCDRCASIAIKDPWNKNAKIVPLKDAQSSSHS